MPRATQTQQKTNKTFPLWSPLVGVCCPPESSYGHPISEARAGLRRCMSPQLARSCRSPRCKTTSAFWGTAVEKCSLCDFLFAPSGHRPGRNPGVQRPAAASFVVLSFRKTFACCEPFGPKLTYYSFAANHSASGGPALTDYSGVADVVVSRQVGVIALTIFHEVLHGAATRCEPEGSSALGQMFSSRWRSTICPGHSSIR